MKKYSIVSTSFQTGEIYTEEYDSKEDRIKGAKEMFEREDKEPEELRELLETGFYSDGYDNIEFKEEQ